MIDAGSLEYAHARICARWGARPDEALWHRIEAARELATALQLARAGPLARWIEGVGPDAGAHAIEAALRRHWRDRVTELADWMPPDWRPAIEWCALLVDLPLLLHLARGEPPPAWVADDAALRGWAERVERSALADRTTDRSADRGRAAPSADALELLASARAQPQRLLAAWRAQWRWRCPAGRGAAAVERRLGPLLAQHARAFGAPETIDGWALRRTLQARLAALLRRALVEPVAAFAFLALEALELERLRAELVVRAAFPGRVATP